MIFELTAAAALAATTDDAPNWRDPPDCWDGPQSELTHCAWAEYHQADREMNEQWERTVALMKRLDTEYPPVPAIGQSSYFEALLAGQRAWLEFRDEHCPIYAAGGGSMAPELEGICLRDITRQRTSMLVRLMLNPATGHPFFEDQ